MKPFLILCLVLAASLANAQNFTTEIIDEDPNIQIVIEEPTPGPVQFKTPSQISEPKPAITTEAQVVDDCTECSTAKNRPSNGGLEALASLQQTGQHLENIIAEEGWKNSCDGFVKDGQIGQYGEMVLEQVMKPASFKNIKEGDEDLHKLCPNYSAMNDSSKANVILLIMTSMAFEESSCNNSKSAAGPNGTAKGFFQLHAGEESAYSADCSNYDSKTPRGSISCALNILDKQMSEGNMFRQQDNYWDVLRPKRWSKRTKSYFPNPSFTAIRSAISSFEPCTEKQSKQVDNTTVNKQLYLVMDKKVFHQPVADN